MATITGNWKAEWESKKKIFETETGKKKPSTKFLGIFRQGSGVSKAFAAMDAAYAKTINPRLSGPDRLKALAVFEKTIKAAEKTCAAYTKLLDKELKKEGKDQKGVPLEKTVSPLLKILKNDIDLCLTSANGLLESGRGMSDATGKVDLRKATDMKQFMSRLPANLKQAGMWISVQNQNPDVATFNEGVNKATRDISQNLNNIRLKLQNGSKHRKTAEALLAPLLPWANGGKKLKDTDTFAEVITELNKLKVAIANIAKWHKMMANGRKAEEMIDDLI